MFVNQGWRERGVGTALLCHPARLTLARGCGGLEWAALDCNRLAIDFYLQLGAEAMSEWSTYRLTGRALERLAR